MVDKTATSGSLSPTAIQELAESEVRVQNHTGGTLIDFSKEKGETELEENAIEFVVSKLRPSLQDNEENLRKKLQQGGVTIKEFSELENQLQELEVINSTRATQSAFITKFLFSLNGSKDKKKISSVISGVIYRGDQIIPILANPLIAANLIASDFGEYPINEDQIYLLKREMKLKSQDLRYWPTSYHRDGVIANAMAENLLAASKKRPSEFFLADIWGIMEPFINENVDLAIRKAFPGRRQGRIEKLLNASEIQRDEAAKAKARKDTTNQYGEIMRAIIDKFRQRSGAGKFSSKEIFDTLFIEYTPLLVRQTANPKAEEAFTLYPILARDENGDLLPEVIGYIPRQWYEVPDEE